MRQPIVGSACQAIVVTQVASCSIETARPVLVTQETAQPGDGHERAESFSPCLAS